ncbi:hypothetical protein [Acidisoma cladoniae]|jgi:hypothetical protein|uniref:bestrophin-like domain n=1 Tax=Acidisoma cladoniae TaxID=3040935 RepID=UPI002550A417|nr:hypothetical protein [Acidisoma sp. PAMC 29798]
MLTSPWIAVVALVLFVGASILGVFVRRRLPERHTNRETIELLQVTVTMLVTFAAIVLGLLITSAKASFDDAGNQFRSYSIALVQLDQSLRDYGPDADPARSVLRAYTAAAIASTWTNEAPPPGSYYPRSLPNNAADLNEESAFLGRMLSQVGRDVRALPTATPQQKRDALDCQQQMDHVVTQRWDLISALQAQLSAPFVVVLVFWLMVIFLCFGLSAPFNILGAAVITLSAISLASALFVVIDLNTLFDNGFFTISSHPERDALAHMLVPDAPYTLPTTAGTAGN